MRIVYALLIPVLVLISCKDDSKIVEETIPIYLGADLSYVNEMLDCGGEYRSDSEVVDPFEFFAENGCNIVRVRLWHNPDWTDYSDFADVKKTIKRSKESGMMILLDFHYSDTWADPSKQYIPKAWESISDVEVLGDSLYNYTFDVLTQLNEENLLPDIVQVGNEINSEILQKEESMNTSSINWARNVSLLNKGIQAVNDINTTSGSNVEVMLHIAQPENVVWWFENAVENGIDEFDWIGISYYPKWSSYKLDRLNIVLDSIKTTFGKRIMIVETAYPYSFISVDNANNILDQQTLIEGYEATPEGQLKYLIDLTNQVIAGGGEGVIYWEPAWISTGCSTLWGQGSHWENATFFDAGNNNNALVSFEFYDTENYVQD